MPKPILYVMNMLPGVRSIRMVAHLIDLELEEVWIDLFAGEHLTESFLKMNPQHTLPTLNDDGKYIWESSVICTYLIDKYAENDELYPKDLYERAKCNQRLHFTDAILYQRLRNCSLTFYKGGTVVPKEHIDSLYEAHDLLEKFLADSDYLLGDRLTVADLCAIPLISSIDEIYAKIDSKKYPRLSAWFNQKKKLPFYNDMEVPHVAEYKAILADIKAKNERAIETSH